MRSLPAYERLQRQLEKYLPRRNAKKQFSQSQLPVSVTPHDLEVERLVELACQVYQLHAGFAQQLEERILSHHATLSQHAKNKADWLFSSSFRLSMKTSVLVAVALVCFLLGTSLIALAAPATSPGNPLYTVKQWEQDVQKQTIGVLNPNSIATQATQVALPNLAVNVNRKEIHASKKLVKDVEIGPKSNGPGRKKNIRGGKDGKSHNVGSNHIHR